jgi:hypothetical protein
MTVDISKLVPAASLVGEDEEETGELRELAARAKDFVKSFEWCQTVEDVRTGIAVAGVIGVFLVRIIPRRIDVDDALWVVVGDLPPAYLVTDDAPTAVRAIEIYIGLMQEWVDAVKAGRRVEELVPVNAEPTKEVAEMLQSRLDFLTNRLLPAFRTDM